VTAGAPPRDWDAATYDRVADPQEAWGRQVLDRLELDGDETVLDAGCGSGRVTELLVERLPRGRVIGVDASPAMIARARERLGDRAVLIARDLLDLDLEAEVDAIFSSATFHWIREHDRLFARLATALRPGGRMEAQCGGIGNVAEFLRTVDAVSGDERFAPYLRGVHENWNFASPGDTEGRLVRAGFVAVSCWLEPSPQVPSYPRGYLRSVCLGPHLERLPPEAREPFATAVLESQPQPLTLDYVRLNISARRDDCA
jgi:trans-aconitate 2-methyltransferase